MFSIPFNKKKIFSSVAMLAVVVFLISVPSIVQAQLFGFDLTPSGIASTLIDMVIGFATNLMLTVGSWLVWAAGVFLNTVVKFTIIDFGTTVGNIGAIKDAWLIIRDLSNMVFIFVLIYIGIMTIVQANVSGTKTLVRNVIIAALFINFSLFITQVVIDASNIVSVAFYNVIAPGGSGVNAVDGGISNQFMQSLNLGSIYEPATRNPADVNTQGLFTGTAQNLSGLLMGFLGFVFMAVAAIVFMAAGVMLLRRFVVIVFLMIFSPLAFVGIILPKVPAKRFWSALTAEAIYAPVFFIIVFVALKLIAGLKIAANIAPNASLSAAVSGAATAFMSITLNFFVVIAFLVMAIKVARDLGAKGGEGATAFAGKAIFGGLGFVGRQTIGRYANKFNDTALAERWRSGNALQRAAVAPLNTISNASFDARNTAAGRTLSKNVGDLGTGSKEGFKGYFDTQVKRQAEYHKQAGRDTVKEAEIEKKKDGVRENQIKLRNLEAVPLSTDPTIKARQQSTIADLKATIAKDVSDISREEKKYEGAKKERSAQVAAQLSARSQKRWGWLNSKTAKVATLGFSSKFNVTQKKAAEATFDAYKPSKDDAFDAKVDAHSSNIKADITKVEDVLTKELKTPKERAALVRTFKDAANTNEIAALKLIAAKLNVADLSAIQRDNELQPHQKDAINEVVNELATSPDPEKYKKDFDTYLAGPAKAFWQV